MRETRATADARSGAAIAALSGGIAVLMLLCLAAACLMATGPALAEPPLVDAAKAGDTVTVAALLAAGADPDGHDAHRNTALIFAARDGHPAMAKALIAAGATVDWQDGERVTPLILAAHKNHPALARLLLDHGADPSIRDQWGRAALDYALRRGPEDPIARMIGENGEEKGK